MNTKSLLTRIAVPVLSLGLLGGIGATLATSASASTLPGTSNSQTIQKTGQNAFTYGDPVFGNVKVNETHHAKFDTVGGTILDGPRADLAGTSGDVGWYSDFTGQLGTLHYTVNDTGTGYSGQATYPAPPAA